MLYIIKGDYFLSDYILDGISGKDNIAMIRFERIKYRGFKKYLQIIIRFLRSKIINRQGLWTDWFFSERFLKQLSMIGEEDKVLLFSCQNLKELLVLDKEIRCRNKSVFIWNPLLTINSNAYSRWKYRSCLHRTGMRICTFDEGDAREYGFEKVNQVYRKPGSELTENNREEGRDVFFVGKDKKRSGVLSELLAELDRQNITHELHILCEKHTRPVKELMPYYTHEPISYKDYCMKAMQSRCMLEILQEGQTGMTMRCLEALFFKKKLITTNASIRNNSIYHPDNIYVLDGKENRTLKAFMDCGWHDVPSQLTDRYDIEHWISQFC